MDKKVQPKINQLLQLIQPNTYRTPTYHNQDLLNITCRIEFEPFGRASETWEVVWEVSLPQHQGYWESTKGWKARNDGVSTTIRGRSLEGVLDKTINYLEETEKERNEHE